MMRELTVPGRDDGSRLEAPAAQVPVAPRPALDIRTPLLLAATVLLVASSVAILLFAHRTQAVLPLHGRASGAPGGTGGASAPPGPSPATIRVTFESAPPGARVTEGEAVLGVTPFMRAFPATPERERTFLFAREGYEGTQVASTLGGEDAIVKATLAELPAAGPASADTRPTSRPGPEPGSGPGSGSGSGPGPGSGSGPAGAPRRGPARRVRGAAIGGERSPAGAPLDASGGAGGLIEDESSVPMVTDDQDVPLVE